MSGYAERLKAANDGIKFTNIKGKDYAEVNQRILAFWSLFPEGQIVTQKTFDDGTRCDFRAEVYRSEADTRPAAVGNAYELKGGGVNATSYVENCETSAVGRALGMLGIGATTAIASADEVLNAIQSQSKAQKAAEAPNYPSRDYTRLTELKKQFAEATGVSEEAAASAITTKYGDVRRMTDAEYQKVLTAIEAEVSGYARR